MTVAVKRIVRPRVCTGSLPTHRPGGSNVFLSYHSWPLTAGDSSQVDRPSTQEKHRRSDGQSDLINLRLSGHKHRYRPRATLVYAIKGGGYLYLGRGCARGKWGQTLSEHGRHQGVHRHTQTGCKQILFAGVWGRRAAGGSGGRL